MTAGVLGPWASSTPPRPCSSVAPGETLQTGRIPLPAPGPVPSTRQVKRSFPKPRPALNTKHGLSLIISGLEVGAQAPGGLLKGLQCVPERELLCRHGTRARTGTPCTVPQEGPSVPPSLQKLCCPDDRYRAFGDKGRLDKGLLSFSRSQH